MTPVGAVDGRDEQLRRLRADWETLGAADPLWAVYVKDGARDGGWDVTEFLATGEREIADSWARHAEVVGSPPPADGTVLDFGCGVGRLGSALAARSRRVIGVDLSEPMLRTWPDVVPSAVRPRMQPVLSSSASIPLRDASIDLVYTSLVLQHMPAELAVGYLREFLRVLKPGGTAMVQVADRPDTSVKGRAFRFLPPGLYGWLQQRLLGYPAPMRMQQLTLDDVAATAAASGGRILADWEDTSYGGHWHYRRILISRAA
ncbi:MAG: methyltransferase domain-containing protein [Actinobacteria bacterium]|nr:methyltransferase domain-containing protein [Actinomycetota bacterium]